MSKDSSPPTALLVVLAVTGLVAATFGRKQHASDREALAGVPAARTGKVRPSATAKGGVQSNRIGSDADAPHQIPPAGWWNVIKRAGAGFMQDRLMTEAAGVTFYTLLAIFPAMASFISIYGLVADPASVNDQLNSLNGVVPGGGLDILHDQLKALTSGPKTALGFGVLIGLGTSLWSANQGIKAMFDALNVVYHEKEKRSYVWLTAQCLLFTVSAILFIVVALVCIAVVPLVLKFFGLQDQAAGLIAMARWPVLMVVLSFLLTLIYRYGPSRRRARWQWVSWGSGFASVTWLAASIGFSYYVSNFGSYNKTYGSLGAVVGFMTWIWISTMIILLGAELNAELEQQTLRDSTVGPDKPIGQRGAFKADNK